jgi:pimeloyl-ACP methyl ester carboxylesterase
MLYPNCSSYKSPWDTMDEKQPFVLRPGDRPARGGWKHARFVIVGALIWLVLYQLTVRAPRHHPHHCHDGRLSYAGETITWERCPGDVNGRPLECSTIEVPMDQFDAENSGNKTFSIPLIRLRGKNATQNLVLNPGGPGGSGINFMYRRGGDLNTIVGEGFHLVSFDPRGVNGSRPLASCYPDQEARRALSSVRGSKVIEDSPELYAWTRNFVQACAATMGEHGKYVNTPQTAADMNSILDALGQRDMAYWGFSYGTLLGQTYAGLFPERSRRVIIDGVANQFDWYDGTFDQESLVDAEHVLDSFFDECIKAGENCALNSVAGSKEELYNRTMALLDSLEEPVSVYVNNTVYGTLNYEALLFKMVFPSLYKPASWYTLADCLARWLEGNATAAFLQSGRGRPWDLVGDADSFVMMNDGRTGPEYWPQDRQSLLDELIPYLGHGLFGPTENSIYYTKQQWAVERTHGYIPKYGVETAHPLLILSTTYDPVCPLISARSANKAFAGSQIVEVKGYGHCSIAVSSTCTARHVRDFLYNGTLPGGYTQCEVDGPYFVKPEEDGKVVALKEFDDDEEMRIHLAQLRIARDMEWPAGH